MLTSHLIIKLESKETQKNPTHPPRHHHILTHNHHWQQNPNPSTKLRSKKLVVNPPLHRNPQPPPLQIKLSPQIHYLRPQPQTKTINHRRPTLCGDHRRPSPTIAFKNVATALGSVESGVEDLTWLNKFGKFVKGRQIREERLNERKRETEGWEGERMPNSMKPFS